MFLPVMFFILVLCPLIILSLILNRDITKINLLTNI